MPNLTKEMLQQIQQKADGFNDIAKFNKEFLLEQFNKPITTSQPTNEQMVDIYAMILAYLRNNNTDTLDTSVRSLLIKNYNIVPKQIQGFCDNADDLSIVQEINGFGRVDYMEDELDDNSSQIEELVEREKKYSEKADDYFVLLNGEFFKSMIDSDRIQQTIDADNSKRDETVDEELRRYYVSANAKVNSMTGEPIKKTAENIREDAKENIGIYLALRQRGENRGFWDVIFHPIDTFKEWKLRGEVKDTIKQKYNITDDTLDKINNMVCVEKQVKKDFLAFGKDGRELLTTNTEEEKKEFFKNLYGMYGIEDLTRLYTGRDNSKSKSQNISKSNDINNGDIEINIDNNQNNNINIIDDMNNNPLINIAKDTRSEMDNSEITEINTNIKIDDLSKNI